MPSILNFDEINRLAGKKRNPTIKEYFASIPGLTDAQRRKREQIATDIRDGVKDILGFAFFALSYSVTDWEAIRRQMEDIVFLILAGVFDDNDEDMSTHVRNVIAEIVDTTAKNTGDAYYFSSDRADSIGENLTQQVMNNVEFKQAIAAGMTKKQWLSMRDARVRPTHVTADGQIQNIGSPFVVGNSLLMFPGDWSLGAEPDEIINCRCGITYL